ncbi:surfeit locus protein 2-like [Pecten maximus]|uniref:surfeit locus protein 2-like n=1 Tax=Pecten maximus TaxID=6579 RepID=UPI001458C262|nr:surfeit locus protein 2-like [Pecten maximus]
MTATGELHVELLSKELQGILEKYPTFTLQKGREKIRCELSGHEMPCTYETVSSYISGKKFQRLIAQQNYDYEKYKQHIIPSTKRGRKHQLFCLLTLRHLNNLPNHIKSHVEGRRFLKAFRRWEECQRTGEVFKPLTGKRKLEEDSISHPDEADSDDEESETDSLSDLYPAADFKDDDDDDDDDDNGDEEDMDDSGQDVDNNHMKKNGRVSNDPQSDSDFEFESLEEGPGVTSEKLDVSVKTESNKRKLKKEKTPKKQIKKKK